MDRIVKGMEAAFVKLGGEMVGFLPFSECREKPRSGDRIIVQVKKPPVGEKAAYLTMDIALAGRFVLLTPFTQRFAVSKKIEDEETRSRLAALASRIAPEGMGLVMRTESAEAEETAIAEDAAILEAAWKDVLQRRAEITEPGGRAPSPPAGRARTNRKHPHRPARGNQRRQRPGSKLPQSL